MSKELEKKLERIFGKHEAAFHDFGMLKVLDFKKPGTNEYRVRFIFEEDHYTLHISGDLGNLTAVNYHNMRFGEFYKDFACNPYSNFREKICCCDRPLYYFDENKAKKELYEVLNTCFDEDDIRELEESGTIDDIFDEFDEDSGFSDEILERINDRLIHDSYTVYNDLAFAGKAETDIIEYYMYAFRKAYEQVMDHHYLALVMEYAEKQFHSGFGSEDDVVGFECSGQYIITPWMDPTGRFPFDTQKAFEVYGAYNVLTYIENLCNANQSLAEMQIPDIGVLLFKISKDEETIFVWKHGSNDYSCGFKNGDFSVRGTVDDIIGELIPYFPGKEIVTE